MSVNSTEIKQEKVWKKILCSENAKKVSRKNPWGSKSYAELITEAIDSSNNKRMTLSEIYEYIIRNVPYFHDKGDSKSSCGWKNSIRHNLSLHNRFQRIQPDDNETTNRCSYWQMNPVAGTQNTPRRRSSRSRRRNRTRIRHSMIYNSGQLLSNRASLPNLPFLGRDNFSIFQENLMSSPSRSSVVSTTTTSADLFINSKTVSEFDLRNYRSLQITDLKYCSNTPMTNNSYLNDSPPNTDKTDRSNVMNINPYPLQFQFNAGLFSGNLCMPENQHSNKSFIENVSTENGAGDCHLNEGDVKSGYGSTLPLTGAGCFTSAHHLSGSFVTTNTAEYSNSSGLSEYMNASTNDPKTVSFTDTSDSKTIIYDKSEFINIPIDENQPINSSESKFEFLNKSVEFQSTNTAEFDNNADSKTSNLDDAVFFNISSRLFLANKQSHEKESVADSEINLKSNYDKLITNYPDRTKSLSREMNLSGLFSNDTMGNLDHAISKNETSIRDMNEPEKNLILEISSYQEGNKIDMLNKTVEHENLSDLKMYKLNNTRQKDVFWDQDFTLLGFDDAKIEPSPLLDTFSNAIFTSSSVRSFTDKGKCNPEVLKKCEQEVEAILHRMWREDYAITATEDTVKTDCEFTSESFSEMELDKIYKENLKENESRSYEFASDYDCFRSLNSDSNEFDFKVKVKNECEEDGKSHCYQSSLSNTINKKVVDSIKDIHKLHYTNSTKNNIPEDMEMLDISSIHLTATFDNFSDDNCVPENVCDSETFDFSNTDSSIQSSPEITQQFDSYYDSRCLDLEEDVSTLNELNFTSENQQNEFFFSDEEILLNDTYDFSMPEFDDLNEQPSHETEWHLTDSVFPEVNLRIDDIYPNELNGAQKHYLDNINLCEISDKNSFIDFVNYNNEIDRRFALANKVKIECSTEFDGIRQGKSILSNSNFDHSYITNGHKHLKISEEIAFLKNCNALKSGRRLPKSLKHMNSPNNIHDHTSSSINRIVNNLRNKVENNTQYESSSVFRDAPNNDIFETVFSEVKLEDFGLIMQKTFPDSSEKKLPIFKRKDSGFSESCAEKLIEVNENSDTVICLNSISSEESNDTEDLDPENEEMVDKHSPK